MYAVVRCTSCSRFRVADLSEKESGCPFCGNRDIAKNQKKYFESGDQSAARAALAKLTGFEGSAEKKHANPDTDPRSTLAYRYEHCTSLEEKMEVLSEGLTAIYGTFTLENIEEFDAKNAEKMLKAMLDRCIVYETKYGHYRA